VYWFNSLNKLELPISIHSAKGTAEESALVDSGAMENFMDRQLVERIKLGTQRLDQPIKLRNIDRTFNTTGQITHFLDLLVTRGNKKVKERFYVTGLSGIEIILGYPWLRDFNPQINWPTNELIGPAVKLSTTTHQPLPHIRQLLMDSWGVTLHNDGEAQGAKKTIERPSEIAENPELDPKEETKHQIPKQYHEYLDIFMKPVAGQLPPHREWDLKVRLVPGAPTSISCTPYKLSRPEQEFQTQYIQENLARGFIQESNPPYSTPVFYNRKKDGGFRPLFNYRKINAITIKDVSPLPRITTILEDTIGAVLFSKFDLREGYYNVAIEEESQDILAFKTTEGLYAPTVMPFGPTNCPAVMQKFMNHVFQPLYDQYGPHFKNYMDDCGIFTHEGEMDLHRQITRDFFTILRENSLFLKPSKCLFEVTEIDFLGLRLTSVGITIAPDKLSAIADWPRVPCNLKDLRKVLGVLGYQRPFIPGFASIARPMTALLKKGADFV